MHVTRKLMALLVVVALVFGLVGTAFAATNSKQQAAAEFLAGFGLVKGVAPGDYALDKTLTRAELATVAVRIRYGADAEKLAGLLKGSTRFSDIASHPWASGYIALAANDGIVNGYPDGSFKPDAPVTYEQAAAMLLRLLDPDFKGEWPTAYITEAQELGLLDNVPSFKVGAPALRGDVFIMEKVTVFEVQFTDGTTLAQNTLDDQAPVVTASLDITEKVTSKLAVKVTGTVDDAVAVFVNDKAVELKDKAFSADVDLVVGANTIEVGAVDAVGNEGVAKFEITRKAGEVAKVTLEVPAEVKAGAAVNVVAKAFDANGVEVKDAVIDIALAGVLVKGADGSYTAATKVGEGKVVASVGEVKAEAAVKVVAGALAKIVVEPAVINLAAGQGQQFAVKGQDAYGNEVAVAAPQWTSTGGAINNSGFFAAAGSGAITVKAVVGEISGEAKVTVFGTATKIALSTPETLVANTKSTTTLTATVVDASGNLVPAGEYTINFTSLNPGAVTIDGSSSVKTVGGVATVTLKSTSTAGSALIAVSEANGRLTGAQVTATTTAQVATSIKLAADPKTVGADGSSKTTITATILDQTGNVFLGSYTQTLTLRTNNPAAAKFAGAETATITSWTSGVGSVNTLAATTTPGVTSITGEITSSATKLPVTPVDVVTLIVGPGNRLAVDTITDTKADGATIQKVTVRVLDANGNQVTSPGTNIWVELTATADAGTPVITAARVQTNGSGYSGQATFDVKHDKAVNVKYVAEAWDAASSGNKIGTITKVEAAGKFVPGAAAKLVATAEPTILAADGMSKAVITVKVVDAKDNLVPTATNAITIKGPASGATIALPAVTTVNAVNGEAKFEVTALSGVNLSNTLTFESKDLATATTPVGTQIVGAPNKLGVYDGDGTSKMAGEKITVKVSVEDFASTASARKIVTSDNGRIVNLAVTSGTATVVNPSVATVNGIATFEIYSEKTGTVAFEATSAGLTKTTGSVSYTDAGKASIAISADPATIAVGGSVTKLTVSFKDKFGNDVNLTADEPVKVTPNITTLGTLTGATADGSVDVLVTATSDKVTVDFTSSSSQGQVIFTGSATGLTSGTVTVTTIITGPANRLVVDSITDTVADGAKKQVVKVSVVDAAGNRVTGYDNTGNKLTATIKSGTANDATVLASYYWAGQATFEFTSTTAGTVEFRLDDDATPDETTEAGLGQVIAAGKFIAGSANKIAGETNVARIKADGSSVALVKAVVQDANGNKVTSFTGTAKFEIVSGADFAVLLATEAPISGGEAAVMIQSKARDLTGAVYVRATTSIDGTDKTTATGGAGGAYADARVIVDGTKPTASAAWDGIDLKKVTITFNEDVTKASAETLSNYVFTDASGGGVTVSAASLAADNKTVTLTLSGDAAATDKVKVQNVVDLVGNTIVTIEFTK